MIDEKQIEEWKALEAKATPGSWTYFYQHKYLSHQVSVPAENSAMRIALFRDGCPTGARDAAFIAAARTAFPLLLAEVESLRAEFVLRAQIIAEIRTALGAPVSVLDTDLPGDVARLRSDLRAARACIRAMDKYAISFGCMQADSLHKAAFDAAMNEEG